MLPSPHGDKVPTLGATATVVHVHSLDNTLLRRAHSVPCAVTPNDATSPSASATNNPLPAETCGTLTDATTTTYVPNAMLLGSAETQLLECIELAPVDHEHEDVHIDLGAPPMLPIYHESPEEAAEHSLPEDTSRRLMWLFLLGFALLASSQAICLRVPSIIDPDNVMAGGVYIISYLCGEVIPMSGFTYYNLRKHPINMAAWRSFAIGFLAGGSNIIGITGNLNLNAQGGETSLLVPLTNLYVVVPVVSGVLCLGDTLTIKKGLGILLGVGATMMFAFGGGSSFDLGDSNTLGFFAMTIIGWGVCTPLYQVVGMWSEARYTAGYMGSVIGFFAVGIIIAATWMGGARLETYDLRNLCITAAGLLHGFANICFLGLTYAMPGQASVVAPLSSLYVVIPVTVGMAAFNESVTPLKIVGILVAVGAVLMISVSSFEELKALVCNTARKRLPKPEQQKEAIASLPPYLTLSQAPLHNVQPLANGLSSSG
eukprot:m.5011 g.5011  ORF g.5011 m.5011 type:complete len:486 (-) comp7362_c0_seq1:82-1539(-)